MNAEFRIIAIFIVACMLGLSQKPKQAMEQCGLGGHACNCAAHVQEVQQAYVDACKKSSKDPKALDACVKAMPAHCSIVDRYGDYDPTSGEYTETPMSERCAMACKKSHCTCSSNEEVCHLGHMLEDDIKASGQGRDGQNPSSRRAR
jgi:hypothetical protein